MTPHEDLIDPRLFTPSVPPMEAVEDIDSSDDYQPPSGEEYDPPGPDEPSRSEFTFPELIDQEAMGYRAWGTPMGNFLAREMEKLAQMVRWTDATTPEQHEARMEVWDDEIRQQWEARGYEEGRNVGCRCGECSVD